MKIERIPKDLMLTFDAIKPYEFDEAFFRTLSNGEIVIRGLSPERVVQDIRFLRERGAVDFVDSPRYGRHFVLTPEGREYRREIRIELFASVARLFVQIIAGASGGLAVFVLSHIFS